MGGGEGRARGRVGGAHDHNLAASICARHTHAGPRAGCATPTQHPSLQAGDLNGVNYTDVVLGHGDMLWFEGDAGMRIPHVVLDRKGAASLRLILTYANA